MLLDPGAATVKLCAALRWVPDAGCAPIAAPADVRFPKWFSNVLVHSREEKPVIAAALTEALAAPDRLPTLRADLEVVLGPLVAFDVIVSSAPIDA